MTATVARSRPRTVTTAVAARSRAADRAWIVVVVVAANALVAVGLWFRHGGLDNATGPGATPTAIGQLTGLLGAYAVLLELLLMARMPWLERYMGLNRLAVWHRWNGFAAVWLLVAHTVFITIGYAASDRQSLVGQTLDFVNHYPDVLMAFVGLALFIGVAVASARLARRALRRETWYLLHLYAYLAVALGFAHQLAVGNDFSDDPVARAWWVSLYVLVMGSILAWRVGWPLWFNARHRLRVERVEREAPGVVSIYMTGHGVDRMKIRPGQFFLWRFLTRDGWWKSHPFSISAGPTKRRLRITVKDLGDHTGALQQVRRGTGVFAEGPYGTFTAERRTRRKVLLVAGGIGITPLRALLDSLPADKGDVTLLTGSSTMTTPYSGMSCASLPRHAGSSSASASDLRSATTRPTVSGCRHCARWCRTYASATAMCADHRGSSTRSADASRSSACRSHKCTSSDSSSERCR
jgi:predicted ferric reductase